MHACTELQLQSSVSATETALALLGKKGLSREVQSSLSREHTGRLRTHWRVRGQAFPKALAVFPPWATPWPVQEPVPF